MDLSSMKKITICNRNKCRNWID